jgi:hypothetical protein
MAETTDPEILERQRALDERRALRLRDVRRAVMDTPQGRFFISTLIAECGVLKSGFVADPMLLQFREGERNVGVSLMADVLRDAPRSYRAMEDEMAQRIAQDAREDAAALLKESDDERDGDGSAH